MLTIFASFRKEWTLLFRDKIGLLILLLLPMLLVLFISLSHGGKTKNNLNILLANQDQSNLAQTLAKKLSSNEALAITNIKDKSMRLDAAESAVQQGNYHALLVIPKGFASSLQQSIQTGVATKKSIQLLMDPGLSTMISANLQYPLQIALKNIELSIVKKAAGMQAISHNKLLISKATVPPKSQIKPNAVQQNVPAWALFGMFFILIPMAGNMVREREFGVIQRLNIAPVFRVDLLLGKIMTFVIFNQIQLWLMLSIGLFILPLFDMPTLELAHHVPLIILTGLAASFAATSFGVLVGSYAKSYEQATVLGPFIVVLASAIGGIFVPSYLMPTAIQKISQLSPLNWGQSAFLDIFVRDESLATVWPALTKLCAFAVICLFISLLKGRHLFKSRKIIMRCQTST